MTAVSIIFIIIIQRISGFKLRSNLHNGCIDERLIFIHTQYNYKICLENSAQYGGGEKLRHFVIVLTMSKYVTKCRHDILRLRFVL